MTVKLVASPYYSSAVYTGKEYVGIVRLHNAIENEHQLARVSAYKCVLSVKKVAIFPFWIVQFGIMEWSIVKTY